MQTDVAIVGGGPGGAATALFLARRGIHSTIIEKDPFPRFHIGESLTGECGRHLRELGLADQLESEEYPIKHGVTVYNGNGTGEFWVPVMARDPQAGHVAATTWQVRRSTFDRILLNSAIERGATLRQAAATDVIRDRQGDVSGVQVQSDNGGHEEILADVVVDASGQSTFLARCGVIGPKLRGNYDKQLAVFSHFADVDRDQGDRCDSTIIYYSRKNHWGWYIPISPDAVSIGVVSPSSYFASSGEDRETFLRRELRELNPKLSERLPVVNMVEEPRAASNYSYHLRQFTGRNFLCVGDAHRFVDPIFSFGLYFAVSEAERAAQEIEKFLGQSSRDEENPFADYERYCETGQDSVQDMIDAFWNHPFAFAVFVHSRYRADMIDMFAGRVYEQERSPGHLALRKINAKSVESLSV